MVKQGKDEYKRKIRRPPHTSNGWRSITLFGSLLWNEHVDQERANVCNERTGRRMQSRCIQEIVQCETINKSYEC